VQLILGLIGAGASCILGMYAIAFLERKLSVPADSALSMTLSIFFGVAIAMLSALQQDYPTLYKNLQSYLFGQAATMTSIHLYIFSILAVGMVLSIFLFF